MIAGIVLYSMSVIYTFTAVTLIHSDYIVSAADVGMIVGIVLYSMSVICTFAAATLIHSDYIVSAADVGMIVGIVIGVLAVAAVIAVLFVLWRKGLFPRSEYNYPTFTKCR